MGFGLEIYQTKTDDKTLNNAIKTMTKILEENKDKFIDNLPIKVNPFSFTYTSEESQKEWKKAYSIDENFTAEQCFNYFKEKYKIEEDDVEDARKIIAVRYEITRNGYSTTRSVKIASDISRESAVKIREQNSELSGMNIITEPIVKYTSGALASHVLGYVGAIDENEYSTRKDTYRNDDVIGKNGIQYVFEEYLKGTDGVRQIDMAVDGSITSEYISEEAVAGDDVILTIDAKLQEVAEKALVSADITVNKNMVPFDSRSAFQTSGIRLGTPAITTRGAKEDLMIEIAEMIETVLSNVENEEVIAQVRARVNETMKKYPLFAD